MSEGKIFGLIGQATQMIGAIGKDSKNQQQGFSYRGIDAVMNALNPVMSKLGLFMCPEVLEQTREERVNSNGKTLLYSVLKIKYTMYAPDGSNVSCVVIGEGMDTGDKASNKAMSIALKYACFQLFMIPTEEMVDPDAECHEVKAKPAKAASAKAPKEAVVTTAQKVPENVPPVLTYLSTERDNLMKARGISKAENAAIWTKQVEVLKGAGLVPNKALSTFTMEEAKHLVNFMYTKFDECGTELKKDDGETA